MASNINNFADGLVKDADGIWVPRSKANVSYPDEGNDWCFAVEEGSFWFRHRNAVIAEVVKRHAPSGGPIFDIGGGNGYVANGLNQAGFETVLVEPGRSGAQNARRRGLPNVICSTAESAGFLPQSLPAIGMFDVLEHIQDDVAMLRNFHQVMRPDGKLFLTVPALRSLWSYEDTFAGHFRRYTNQSLARVLRQAGFEIEFQSYFFWFLPVPIFCLRSIPTVLALKRSVSAESMGNDHAAGSPMVRRIIDRMLAPELNALRSGRSVKYGSSAIVVARAARKDSDLTRTVRRAA